MRILILGVALSLVWRLAIVAPVQQDNYADYAISLAQGDLTRIPWADTRLFPGYPLAIIAFAYITSDFFSAGLWISSIMTIAALYLHYQLFRDKLATLLWAIFPVVWVELGAKIANEPLAIMLFLLSLTLFSKSRPFLSGYIAGLSVLVRLIGSVLGLTIFYMAPAKEKVKVAVGFLLGALTLPLYNLIVFGPDNLLYQLFINPAVGGAGGLAIGVWQLPLDIIRAFAWHQWRIGIVGTLYVLFVALGTYLLYLYRNKIRLGQFVLTWHIAILVFVLSLAPIPLLEEFPRYMVPSYPLLLLGYAHYIRERFILTA